MSKMYVGLDTAKKHIDVAVGGEVRYRGQIGSDAASVDRLVNKLGQGGRELVMCDEAGPCGWVVPAIVGQAWGKVHGRGAVDGATAGGRSIRGASPVRGN